MEAESRIKMNKYIRGESMSYSFQKLNDYYFRKRIQNKLIELIKMKVLKLVMSGVFTDKYYSLALDYSRYSTPSLIRTALYQIKIRSFGLLNLFRLVRRSFLWESIYPNLTNQKYFLLHTLF